MNVEIQTQHVEMENSWRALIDERLAKLAGRYPVLLRVHVTLKHGEHHQHGAEEVDLVATVPGMTLRAAKEDADMIAALHAAFDALEHEIQRQHDQHRRKPRSPSRGSRPGPGASREAGDEPPR